MIIRPGITEIVSRVFSGCQNLTTVEISNTVTSIGYCAFEHCPKLTSIKISDSVTNIGEKAFRNCDNLTLCVFKGSYAENHAIENNIPLKILPTVINHVLHTDIKAYIDGKPIRSYNIDGCTAMMAEDLLKYGFKVVWDGEARTLKITEGSKTITSAFFSEENTNPVGSVAMDVFYTDIKTYVNDREVNGFNVNGYTVIFIDELKDFGKIAWDGQNRTISFTRK